MRLLVCGGRKYCEVPNDIPESEYFAALDVARAERHFLFQSLGMFHKEKLIDCLIEGGAHGADDWAKKWAMRNDVKVQTFKADWKKHFKSAGPIRNQQMIDEGKPDAAMCFPGGRGTKDMLERCIKAGLPVVEYR